MRVHNTLGFGFLEKIYENSLMVLLKREGITAKQQAPITVYFEGENVGEYFAGILIEDKIVLELKSGEIIVDAHRAQTLNYLMATGISMAIILNFGKERLEYERLVV